MRRWAISAVGGLSVLCSPAAAQTLGLTFNDIDSLTDPEIVARTMAQIGADIVYVNRHPQQVMFIDPTEPSRTTVRFMLRAHAVAGMRGLCAIPFWDVFYEERGKNRPTEHVFTGLSVETRYRVVGEVALNDQQEASLGKETAVLCAAIKTPDELLIATEYNVAFQAASLAQAISVKQNPPPTIDCKLIEGCEIFIGKISARNIGWATYCYEGTGRTWRGDETCTEFSIRDTGDKTYSGIYLRVVAAVELDPFRWRVRTIDVERRARGIY